MSLMMRLDRSTWPLPACAAGGRLPRPPSPAPVLDSCVPIDASVSTAVSFNARFFENANHRFRAGDSGDRPDGRVGVHELERVQRVEHDRVVLAERLAFVEDAHEHRHDSSVASRDQRVDDRPALFAVAARSTV